MVGKGSEKLIRDVLALDYDAARIDAVFDEAMAAYQRHYLAINGERSVLYEGVIEGLEAMKNMGLRLACVTNKPIAFATPLLAQKGLAPYFELVYGGDSLPRKKARSPAAAAGVRAISTWLRPRWWRSATPRTMPKRRARHVASCSQCHMVITTEGLCKTSIPMV